MAQQVLTSLVDDIDGSEATDTIEFAIDGKAFEIDLSDEHINKLRGALEPFLAAARRAGGSAPRRQAQPTSTGPRRDLSEVRSWLVANGYEVKDRGRIGADLMQAFETKTPAGGDSEPAETTKPHVVEFQAAG